MGLFDRYLEGPILEGRIFDAGGHPVVAEVHLAERKRFEGESWKSRCRDGFFARWLAEPGTYHLRVKVPGSDEVLEREVEVRGRSEVTIQLDGEVPPSPCPPLP